VRHFLSRRSLAAVVAGIVVFSTAYAAAASLNIGSSDLAAGNATVGACDSSVSTSYSVSFNATSLKYVVDSVTVSGIADACLDEDFAVSLVGSTGVLASASQSDVPAGSFSGSANARSLSFSFTSASPRVAAADVTAVHVSISD
jgi:hypothetical protein